MDPIQLYFQAEKLLNMAVINVKEYFYKMLEKHYKSIGYSYERENTIMEEWCYGVNDEFGRTTEIIKICNDRGETFSLLLHDRFRDFGLHIIYGSNIEKIYFDSRYSTDVMIQLSPECIKYKRIKMYWDLCNFNEEIKIFLHNLNNKLIYPD